MKNRTVIILAVVLTAVAVGQVVMSVVLFNREGSLWLRIVGWIALLASAIFGQLPMYEFRRKGGVTQGKSYLHTTVLVDSGIYGIVRHPQYLAGIMFHLALVLVTQHWVATTLGAVGAAVYYLSAVLEEQSCIAKFGDSYRRYMESVPRINVVLGVMRWMQRSGNK